MITLENDYIKVSLAAKGAELQGLFNKETGLEYLWNADPRYWAKHSPVLFPIVGSLKNNSFNYQGKNYELPRHGFARDHVFNSEKISETEAVFTLHQSEETLKVYPFYFELKLKYELMERKLKLTYEVSNTGTGAMLFSLGAHPAFAVPNTPDTVYEDYYLAFNTDEKLTYWKLDDGLVADETGNIELNSHKLQLKHDLFYNDALVFKTLKSNHISLLNTKNDYGLHFHFEDFPFFGIWAATDAPFICLEPWCGVADGINHDQELEHKEGIVKLAVGEKWSRFWEVECF
ncbi:aldose 1-epimerase family protein [Pedobacter zeae]|uniref:Galactose mutarotase-like enzyme n=1 Tax=Pedobacter zeae TaxID=1737356 RepID=A0A7W6P843_9SPHI|nr:aldose 1-epimerase family protein [Pedobacter zeae]MBB4109686.1 galactose mutarotase-like enzyme [Pedobacter zeae]GGH13659.1 LACX protein [Pedobacter zeae]